MLRIEAGRLITPLREVENGAVLVDGAVVVAAGPAGEVPSPAGAERIDAATRVVCPGFIDCHIHGGGGYSLAGGPEAIRHVAAGLAAHGTTSFLASLTGAPTLEQLLQQIAAIAEVRREDPHGAQIAGIHLEGPFMSPHKPGANVVANLRAPSILELRMMLDASEQSLRVVTVAPELEGALELIRELARLGITASIGHTDATYDEVEAGINAGATCATHTYNAMNGLGHRAPGAVGAVLTDARVNAELIADGVHVSSVAMQVLIACKGPERTHLVTDNIRWAGLPDGVYESERRGVVVADGACRLGDGTLAGSTSPMNRNVATVSRLPGCGARAAIQMATLSAARAAGIDARTGSIEPGKDADLLVLDDDFHVELALVRGRVIFSALP
jgi:N-acetylglucosamine-6-phosphate deacetylase